MERLAFKLCFMIASRTWEALFFAFSASVLFVTDSPNTSIVANIPFEFSSLTTLMPASRLSPAIYLREKNPTTDFGISSVTETIALLKNDTTNSYNKSFKMISNFLEIVTNKIS